MWAQIFGHWYPMSTQIAGKKNIYIYIIYDYIWMFNHVQPCSTTFNPLSIWYHRVPIAAPCPAWSSKDSFRRSSWIRCNSPWRELRRSSHGWWLDQREDGLWDFQFGYGSIPMKIPFFSGMNIHKSQLFWCELQGYYWFWHTAILEKC